MSLILSSVEIKGFLSYKDSKFNEIRGYNVLIGKNSYGKSNFIKILEFLRDSYNGKDFEKKYLFDKNEEDCKVILKFDFNEDLRQECINLLKNHNAFRNVFVDTLENGRNVRKYANDPNGFSQYLYNEDFFKQLKIEIFYDKETGMIYIRDISLKHSKNDISFPVFGIGRRGVQYELKTRNFPTPNRNPISIQSFLRTTNLANREALKPINIPACIRVIKGQKSLKFYEWLIELIDGFFTNIHIIPPKRDFRSNDVVQDAMNQELNPRGLNLVTYIYKKRNDNEDEWLDSFNKELSFFIPEIKVLQQRVQNNRSYLESKEKGLKMPLPLEHMGAGVLNVALFIAYIKELGTGKILCIEEPELHLHPGLSSMLRDKFMEESKKNQIFITSHLREFLYEDENECSVYLIKKENNQSTVNKIPEENFYEVYEELDIDIDKYKLQQSFLYNEDLLKRFVKKAMEPGRIEDDLWDFKRTLNFWEVTGEAEKKKAKIKFCNQVTSFANTLGGILIIGITDDDPKEILGIPDLENRVKQIKKVIKTFTNNNRDFIKSKDIILEDDNGVLKSCLLIAIKQTKDPIAVKQVDGKYTIYKKRNNTEAETISYEEVLLLKEDILRDNFNYFFQLTEFTNSV